MRWFFLPQGKFFFGRYDALESVLGPSDGRKGGKGSGMLSKYSIDTLIQNGGFVLFPLVDFFQKILLPIDSIDSIDRLFADSR